MALPHLFFWNEVDRGMKRKSNLAKRLSGSARRDRLPKRDLAARLIRAVPPPRGMSDRAKLEWRALMPAVLAIGTMSKADLRAFALLATTLAAESEAREAIERDGMVVVGGSGGRKSHPALKAAETARMQAMRLLESFGLTPRGRQSVDVIPDSMGDRARDASDGFLAHPLLGGSAASRKYFQ
jgi:P27 family predicted phage terminase small subunit